MNPRIIALDLLVKYKKEQCYLNIELNHCFNQYELSLQDKAFITRIVYGSVQYLLYLDYCIQPFIKKIKDYEYMLLIMSMYQHYFMTSIPDYAIVNEAVEIEKKHNPHAAKFINAVLNQAMKSKPDLDALDDDRRLSVTTSHPLWLVKMLKKQYGDEVAIKVLHAFNEPPLSFARINTLKASKEVLIKEGFIQYSLGDYCYKYNGNIAATDAFKNGLVTIQDASSQLVAPLLNPKKGSKVLDMCSAPGSKTTHLAMLMENTGSITAYDLYEHKIKLINQQCERLGVTNINAQAHDATTLTDVYEDETFDAILLDAPCTGLGVLSRKPEIRYHDSSAMDEIIQIQRKLLENSYHLLKKDSIMVYSTCTLNKKENHLQMAWLTNKYPDMQIVEEHTILPYEYHSDGFYMCKLKKG